MQIIPHLLNYPLMWGPDEVYCFTANRTLNSHGELVMGAGAAREVRNKFPGVAKRFGDYIRRYPCHDIPTVQVNEGQWLYAMPVKDFWRDPAELDRIERSFRALDEIAQRHPNIRHHCNYPGIGAGILPFATVQTLLESLNLPDNIILYHHED